MTRALGSRPFDPGFGPWRPPAASICTTLHIIPMLYSSRGSFRLGFAKYLDDEVFE